MRVPTVRVRSGKSLSLKKEKKKPGCLICRRQMCVDELCYIVFHRLTRSTTKFMKEFILYETYRCMPLLGNEKENAPDWEVHIARYHMVFVGK